jgi:hypothetical protein
MSAPGSSRGIRQVVVAIAAIAGLLIAGTGVAVADAPQLDHLVAYFPGDAPTEVINQATGSLVGSATFAPGVRGNAFSFSSPGDAVQFPAASWQYPKAGFSVVAWVKTAQATDLQVIVEEYECGNLCPNNSASSGWYLAVEDGKATGWVRQAQVAGNGQTLTGPDIADGAWHHLAFVRDSQAGTALLYVDGQLSVSEPVNAEGGGPISNDDGDDDPITIGAHVLGGTTNTEHSVVGLVDEVGFYDAALPASAVTALVTLGKAGLGLQNHSAVAVDDSVSVAQDSTDNPIEVVANDTDPDGDQVMIAGGTPAAHGEVACTATACQYTPAPGYSGPDSFTYAATDGDGTTATGRVTILVTAAAATPATATAPAATGAPGGTVPGSSPGAESPASASDSGSGLVVIAIGGIAILVLAILAVILMRRRRPDGSNQ